MEGSSLAILSRHVFLQHDLPVYAAVLIDGETITGVQEFPAELSVKEAVERLGDREVVVEEDAYLLPGLVDMAVRPNGAWQGTTAASRLAISGGVTFFLEEPNSLGLDSPLQDSLYCDVGKVEVISSLPMHRDNNSGCFALKGYLSQPGTTGSGLEGRLRDTLAETNSDLLLILDLFCPPFTLRTTNTPFRTCEVKERLSAPLPSMSDPAAFSDSVDDNAELATQSSLDATMESDSPSGSPRKSFSLENLQIATSKRRKLTEDREMRLLSEMELARYTACGQTTYLRPRSLTKFASPRSGLQRRMQFQVNLAPLVTDRRGEEGGNREYAGYLANYPDFTEAKGVRELANAVEAFPHRRIHITNISSVTALSALIRLRDRHICDLTLETAPHFLYFSAESIREGDTLLKSAPPIRPEDNRKLLSSFLSIGAIDSISSSHSGLSLEHKELLLGDFKRAVSGIAGLGFSLSAVWTALQPASDSQLVKLVRLMSIVPARILGIDTKRGSIAVGKYADLVLFRPRDAVRPPTDPLCPYRSEQLIGRVECVFLRGKPAFRRGECVSFGRYESKSLYSSF